MVDSIRHIALFVPDLQAAEAYYRHVFDMQLADVRHPSKMASGSPCRPNGTAFQTSGEAAGRRLAV